jgi:glycosyltransferase involved in cell wall biosynthesis
MVKEAIQSVLAQTYSDYEIIVVDDGSTDNTREIVTALSDRVIYVYQQNRGRSTARNHAIHLARGKYIAFLDSDDLFLPHKLETQVTCLEKERDFGMVYSSATCIDEQGKETSFMYKATASGRIYHKVAFYRPLTILLPTVMIRAEVLAQVGGFDEKMERFEDTDMWRRVARRYPILAISETLCKVRTHPGNELVNQDPEKILRALTYYVNKAFYEDRSENAIFLRKGAALFYLHYGQGVLAQQRWRPIGRKFLHQSIRFWPFRIYPYWLLIRTRVSGLLHH